MEPDEDMEPDVDMGMVQTGSTKEVLAKIQKVTMRIPNRAVKDLEGPVGFYATNDQAVTLNIGIHQHIIYEDVHLNLRNGFHELHGLFIAPMGGLYIFSTSILSYKNSQSEIAVSIMKNGNALGRAYAHGDSGRHDQGSVTVLVQLAVGDEVWVECGLSTAAEWGDEYTSFMGYLLYQM